MAATNLFMFFVFLLLRAALSLPVSQNTNSLQSPRTVLLDRYKILRRLMDSNQVKSSDSDFVVNVTRNKRQVIKNGGCAEGMVWLSHICVTQKQYDKSKDEYEDKITTTLDFQTTLSPVTAPPSPRTTPNPRTTPSPQTTPNSGTTTRTPSTSRPLTTLSPPKSIELSSGSCVLTPDIGQSQCLIFVLFIIIMRSHYILL